MSKAKFYCTLLALMHIFPLAARAQGRPGSTLTPATNLNLSSTQQNVPASSSGSIMVGGHASHGSIVGATTVPIAKGQLLTPAENLALSQALAGTQRLILDATGAAIAGRVAVSPMVNNNSIFVGTSLSSIVVPKGVTLSAIGFNGGSPMNVAGDASISGKVYALQTLPGLSAVLNFANDLRVEAGGVLSALAPAGASFAGLFSSQNLNINVANNLVNAGTIRSGGELNLNVGGVLSNIATGQSVGTLQAQNLNIFSTSGTIVNSGLMNALDSVSITTSNASGRLSINNNSGVIQALNSIALGGASNLSAVSLKVDGGSLLSDQLNIVAGTGTVELSVNNISGQTNLSAGCAYVYTKDAPMLRLGKIDISGDPTFWNAGGDVTIGGDITYSSADIGIIASRDIYTTGGGTYKLDSNSSGAGSGSITLIAGANITTPGSGSGDNSTTVSYKGVSSTGGNIILETGVTDSFGNTSSGSVSLLSTSSSANAGNIKLIAFGNNSHGGAIAASSTALQSSSAAGNNNGSITVIGGDTSAENIGVRLGSVDASGGTGVGSGSVAVANAAVNDNGGGSVTDGALTGTFSAGALQTVGVSTESIVAYGNITVSAASSSMTIKSVASSTGTVTLQNSGGITVTKTVQAGGDVFVSANGDSNSKISISSGATVSSKSGTVTLDTAYLENNGVVGGDAATGVKVQNSNGVSLSIAGVGTLNSGKAGSNTAISTIFLTLIDGMKQTVSNGNSVAISAGYAQVSGTSEFVGTGKLTMPGLANATGDGTLKTGGDADIALGDFASVTLGVALYAQGTINIRLNSGFESSKPAGTTFLASDKQINIELACCSSIYGVSAPEISFDVSSNIDLLITTPGTTTIAGNFNDNGGNIRSNNSVIVGTVNGINGITNVNQILFIDTSLGTGSLTVNQPVSPSGETILNLSSADLTINVPITGYHSVGLVGDSIKLGASAFISTTHAVGIAPLTAGRDVSLNGSAPGELSLSSGFLSKITTQQLFCCAPTTLFIMPTASSAGSITLRSDLDLSGGSATAYPGDIPGNYQLTLFVNDAFHQNGHSIKVGQSSGLSIYPLNFLQQGTVELNSISGPVDSAFTLGNFKTLVFNAGTFKGLVWDMTVVAKDPIQVNGDVTFDTSLSVGSRIVAGSAAPSLHFLQQSTINGDVDLRFADSDGGSFEFVAGSINGSILTDGAAGKKAGNVSFSGNYLQGSISAAGAGATPGTVAIVEAGSLRIANDASSTIQSISGGKVSLFAQLGIEVLGSALTSTSLEIYSQTKLSVLKGSPLSSSGDVTLRAEQIISTEQIIAGSGSGNLTVAPFLDNSTIGINAGAGTFQVSSSLTSLFSAGKVTIGTANGVGAIELNSVGGSFKAPWNLSILSATNSATNSFKNNGVIDVAAHDLTVQVGGQVLTGQITSANTASINVTASKFTVGSKESVSSGAIQISGAAGSSLEIDNAGKISSTGAGGITVSSAAGSDIKFTSKTGTFSSPSGLVIALVPLANTPNKVEFAANQSLFANTTVNASSGGQSVVIDAGVKINLPSNYTMTVNTSDFSSSGSVGPGKLILNSTVPAVYQNPSGSVTLSNFHFTGPSLTIIASQDIIVSGTKNSVTIDEGSGNSGPILLLAGYQYTESLLSGSPLFTIVSASSKPGKISMGSLGLSTIAANSSGNVSAIASGSISLGAVNATSPGTAGSVSILGNGISVGDVKSGGSVSGSVSISSGTVASVGSVQVSAGKISSGAFQTATPGGNISLKSINAGSGSVSLLTGGSGNISQSQPVSCGYLSVTTGSAGVNLKVAADKVAVHTGGSATITNTVQMDFADSNVAGSLKLTSSGAVVAGAAALVAGKDLKISAALVTLSGTTLSSNNGSISVESQKGLALTIGDNCSIKAAKSVSLTALDVQFSDNVSISAGNNVAITASGSDSFIYFGNANTITAGTLNKASTIPVSPLPLVKTSNPATSNIGSAGYIKMSASGTQGISGLSGNTFTSNGGDINFTSSKGDISLGDSSTVQVNGGSLIMSAKGASVDIGKNTVGSSLTARTLNNASGNVTITGQNLTLSKVDIAAGSSLSITSTPVSGKTLSSATIVGGTLQSNKTVALSANGVSGTLSVGDNTTIVTGVTFGSAIGAGGLNLSSGGTVQIGSKSSLSSNGGDLKVVANNGDVQIGSQNSFVATGGNILVFAKADIEGQNSNSFHATASGSPSAPAQSKGGGIEIGAGLTSSTNLNAAMNKHNVGTGVNPPAGALGAGVVYGPSNNKGGVIQANVSGAGSFINLNAGANGPSTLLLNKGAQVFDSKNGSHVNLDHSSFQTDAFKPIGMTESSMLERVSSYELEPDRSITTGAGLAEVHIVEGRDGSRNCELLISTKPSGKNSTVIGRIFSASNSEYSVSKSGGLYVHRGEMFAHISENIRIDARDISIAAQKGSVLAVRLEDDSTIVRACTGVGELLVEVDGHLIRLNSGEEIAISAVRGTRHFAQPLDGVARRNSKVLNLGSHVVRISDFSIISFLMKERAPNSLFRSSNKADKQLLAKVLKTAATVDTVLKNRGAYFVSNNSSL